MRFKAAVKATRGIAAAYQPRLQAVSRADRAKMTVNDTARIAGSVNLDAALRATKPNAPRWDYGVGWRLSDKRDRVIWIEVHPANTRNVKEVVAKVKWLRKWLHGEAPGLKKLKDPAFVWIASGSVRILKGSPEFRRLAESGLRYPCKHLIVDAC